MMKLCEPLVATGRLSDSEVAEVVGACDDDGFCALYPILVTAWGQRPRAGPG
jgi:hypothetical protein